MNANFTISPDKSRLDIRSIHAYLSERSYWARGRTLETIRMSIENSLCFGVYDPNDRFAGFARVITDQAIFAYLLDVFILEPYRGLGLGKRLIEYIMNFPQLQNLKRWQLITADARGLYERYGFVGLASPDEHMEKVGKERCIGDVYQIIR